MVVKVLVTFKPEIPDPQRTAKLDEVRTAGYAIVTDVRLGKYFEVTMADASRWKTKRLVEEVSNLLLINPVIEQFQILPKGRQGFGSMDPAKQREIAAKGGKASHKKGVAHEWTAGPDGTAAEAGRKGAKASRNCKRQVSPSP